MKTIFFALFHTIIIALVTFALMEFGLRIFPSIIPPSLLVSFHPKVRSQAAQGRFLTIDETVTFDRDDAGPPLRLMKPFTTLRWHNTDEPGDVYTAKVDEIGFCNQPGTYNRSPIIDLITIGDSFTWCNSVHPTDTWTAKLSGTMGISTYNLGRGGVGLYEYIQILEGFGIQKNPQIVILNVYEGNDLRDAVNYHSYRDRTRDEASPPDISKSVQPTLREYSYSLNLIRSISGFVYKSIARSIRGPDVDFEYWLDFASGPIPFNKENTDRDEVRHAKRLFANEIDLEAFTEALETFVDLSQRHKFVPIITYTPSAHSAYAEKVVFSDPDLHSVMPWFSHEQRKFFQLKGQELGFVFIDLTPHLQSVASSADSHKLLYYRRNLHLTPFGHKVVAEALSRSIQSLSLLPSSVAEVKGHSPAFLGVH
ncbi:MAG: hypothetical protein O7D34_02315 [Ignavibacteria bacterium]|nr:hypothetical protein [Ignavibacteria bacterium]